MGTLFSETLVSSRTTAGFKTAYAFYHRNGGEKAFSISYRKYLLLEQGKTLPAFDRVITLMYAMRLPLNSPQAHAFLQSWLRTLVGDKNFSLYISPMLTGMAGARPQETPADKLLGRSLNRNKFHITLEQMEVISRNRINYLCYTALSSDAGAWSAAELAAKMGLPEPAVAEAIKELLKVRIFKAAGKGRVKSRLTGMLVEAPPLENLPEVAARWQRVNEEALAKGRTLFVRGVTLRADKKDFTELYPVLARNTDSAHFYEVKEETRNSALLSVETRVTKLADF